MAQVVAEQLVEQVADQVTDQVVAPAPESRTGGRERVGARVVDGVDVIGSLSPSRAGDFMSCPLLYRFRTIDKLPEEPPPAAVRGTVVHKVLEDLFDLPAAQRTPDRAAALLAPAWESLLEEEPSLAGMFGPEDDELGPWLVSCRDTLQRYFTLEDPRRLEPAERELYVETLLDSKLLLRGFVDRLDVAPTGQVRVVDYKSGRSPAPHFEAKALFQMKFYALVLWRLRGTAPDLLQLMYLGNSEVLRYVPEERDLVAVERKLEAIWKAISRAAETGDWRPNKTALCGWCSHQALCPEFGGTPPPLPVVTRESVVAPGLAPEDSA
jgi:putative RecB family exonuclease